MLARGTEAARAWHVLQGAAAPDVVAGQSQAQCWLCGAGCALCDGTIVELVTVSIKRM